MKGIDALFFPIATSKNMLVSISEELDKLPAQPIDVLPWAPAYAYVPKASFAIAYNNDSILLKYFVKEHSPKAIYWNANDPVYKDSCVAFYISFDGGVSYYNLEFNCVGACLAAYGSGPEDRIAMPPELIRRLQVRAGFDQVNTERPDLVAWQLTVTIPYEVFSYSSIQTLQDSECRCNFYKYGHEVNQPHFLCWNKIESEEPDFHQPRFFGAVNFK
jgi:hypothetical protein